MKPQSIVMLGLASALVATAAPAATQGSPSAPAASSAATGTGPASTRMKTGDTKADSAKAGSAKPGELVGTTFVVLLPMQQSNDKLGNGCWVRFFDGRNYRGSNLTLVGPVDMPNMEVPGALWHDWDSAVVGPKARVSVFDNRNYRDKSATLNPGDHIPDLGDQKLGWFEEVNSARVTCTG